MLVSISLSMKAWTESGNMGNPSVSVLSTMGRCMRRCQRGISYFFRPFGGGSLTPPILVWADSGPGRQSGSRPVIGRRAPRWKA